MSCLNVLRVTLVVGNTDNDEVINVSPQELNDAVMMLKDSKVCGMDTISAEHLKIASRKLYYLHAICYTGFLDHCILPDSILFVMLVPIIKDN